MRVLFVLLIIASISTFAWTDQKAEVTTTTGVHRFDPNNERYCYGPAPTCYELVRYRETDGGEDLPPPPDNWTSIYFPQSGEGFIGILNYSKTPVGNEIRVTFDLSPIYIPVTTLDEILDYYNNYSE